jgi:hypothetical protein
MTQKSQMQLVVSLFERVTGAGDPVAMLKQQITLQRTFEEQSKQRNATPDHHQDDQAPPWWAQMMAQVAPAVSMWAAGKSRQENRRCAVPANGGRNAEPAGHASRT